ncbi:MAG: 2-polyprenyl-3-methyl-5-hydroxy-6-metoxy-1,4-benzoquinol methylase [Vicingaceae bacterium]|jgi:2-polyprenyl-3-methyl-5-hydroxy-6-metoxy-1,4-benzoquinol methylase
MPSPNFKIRSREEELLDQPNIPQAALFQNLKELDTINRLLGGHQATLIGLKKLLKDKSKTYHIVDFACGGGDTLRAVARWAKKNDFKVKLMGFDLLDHAIEFAKKESQGYEIEWKVGDFKTIELPRCDISICSLVCHHFYDDQLESFLTKMKHSANIAALINDLHRHPLAYYGIALLTKLFSKTYLVKSDAKLSVLKGFSKTEWNKLLHQLHFSRYSIKWIWAFRHLIIIEK